LGREKGGLIPKINFLFKIPNGGAGAFSCFPGTRLALVKDVFFRVIFLAYTAGRCRKRKIIDLERKGGNEKKLLLVDAK
jgi:hypothetical protein